ncbi:MAG: lyase family protein [Thermodesulfovibrionales bacterium]|nr:lyase family protein [Thermodesulfovibrionales bacterium]
MKIKPFAAGQKGSSAMPHKRNPKHVDYIFESVFGG